MSTVGLLEKTKVFATILISGGYRIMDCTKIGELIRRLRREKGYTQRALAAEIGVSDKAVSKWERGLGCPDVSLLGALSSKLGVNLEELLAGELDSRERIGGNMKKIKFYICPNCGNVITSLAEAAVYCCGKKLEAMQHVKAEEKLDVENIENDYYISSAHPMTKEHHISFCAFITGDAMTMKKLYPEWDMQLRIPRTGHGMLVWYCTQHGLFYQLV